MGHFARECRKSAARESPGRTTTTTNHVAVLEVGSNTTRPEDLTEAQLEELLAERRLHKEQGLLEDDSGKMCAVTARTRQDSNLVGPTVLLDVEVEGVHIEAVVDTGSQSTIISRETLHAIGRSLRRAGRPLPQLCKPTVKLFGKDGQEDGRELVVTAQLEVTICADGQSACVPVLVQPNSEQACLLGMNAIPLLALSLLRANGQPLRTTAQEEHPKARVRLVKTVTVPLRAGKIVKAEIEGDFRKGECYVFEPGLGALSGLSIPETVVTVGGTGRIFVPLQNLSDTRVKVQRGVELGTVELVQVGHANDVEVKDEVEPVGSTCARVVGGSVVNRNQQLLEALHLNQGGLSEQQFQELQSALLEASDVFAMDSSELGHTSLVQHSIDTGDHPPIKQHPYRTPMIRREQMAKMIDDMQKQGIIQPTSSPWASPVVLVPKKDGTTRFCVDYRRLNAVSRKDVYPLPRIEDILSTLGEANYFSTLDLASGYWQIEMEESSRPKTAFATHQGLFEFTRMPFGLCNAPATFQRLMQVILAGLEWKCCFVYLDDILVASRTFEEHLAHLVEVFSRLRKAGLRLKPKKCAFLRDEVAYLGHIISQEGIRPDPAKVHKVRTFPVPTDVTTLRQFLGLASYYRKFIPGFAKVASPLHDLTKKGSSFCWTSACDKAFQALKELMCDAPVLAYPRFGADATFVLETDASTLGLGAILSQSQPDGMVHPIAYASRSLQPAEKNYGITELETLGLVWAVKYFRPFILGYPCLVFTDHAACLSLLGSPHPSGKLARWAMAIQEMDLTIKHRAGKRNGNADALSRVLEDSTAEMSSTVLTVLAQDDLTAATQSFSPEVQEQLRDIQQQQQRDPELLPLINYLRSGELPEEEKAARKIVMESAKYDLMDGILYFLYPAAPHRSCIVVPKVLQMPLLEETHGGTFAGHFAERKTHDRLRRYYWWRGMRADVRRYCRGCLPCVTKKGGSKPPRPPLHPIPVEGPFHRVGVDVLQLPLTRGGNRYVVVFADYLTKWVEAFAVPDQTADTIARLLVEKVVCVHGVPEQLLSDRGANFLSDLVASVCRLLGITKINTSGYHPQTDGLVEKFNSTLTSMIAKSATKGDDWDERLPYLLFAYRVCAQESTKESPFYLMYGRDPRLPTESALTPPSFACMVDLEDYRTALVAHLSEAWQLAKDNIVKAQERQKVQYDRTSQETKFQVGDRVLVHMPAEMQGKERKLSRPFHGPYLITALTDCNAEVQLVGSTQATIFVSLDRVRPCPKEVGSDVAWTGKSKSPKRARSSNRQTQNSGTTPSHVPPARDVGPVTRSMTRCRDPVPDRKT